MACYLMLASLGGGPAADATAVPSAAIEAIGRDAPATCGTCKQAGRKEAQPGGGQSSGCNTQPEVGLRGLVSNLP